MGKRGPQPKVNPDEVFEWWYNAGERHTYIEAAKHFDLGYATVRKYADDGDWDARADELDVEIRRQRDKKLASTIGKVRAREIEAIATLEARFYRRLIPKLEDGKDNPAAIRPEDLSVQDFALLAKLLELKVGGVPAASQEERADSLEEIERQIAALDMADEGGS